MAGRSNAGAEVQQPSEEFVLRVLDRAMARSNDALSVVTGTLGSQSSLITDLQGLNMDLNRRIQVLQEELGGLKQASLESDRIKADLEVRREELSLKAKRTDAAIKIAQQGLGAVMLEISAGRRLGAAGAISAAGAESAEEVGTGGPPGVRPLEAVLADMWSRFSVETEQRVREEAGPQLVLELLQRLRGSEPTVEEVV